MRDVPSGEPFKTITGYNATGMTNQAIEFIDANADSEKPFLLALSLNPPHYRWDDSPEEFYNLYPEDKLTYRPNVSEADKTNEKKRENYRHYHGHISAVDRELGRMMAALEKAGIAENTVLIYTSDHGSSFGSQGLFNKANPYDEASRVPFIVRWPGRIAKDHITNHNLGTMDLYPTLCGLAGIDAPAHCGGRDFSPTFLGQEAPDSGSQLLLVNNFTRNYYQSRLEPEGQRFDLNPFRGVRTKQFTYAVDSWGEWLLFDNVADPCQMNNLIEDPAHAGTRKRLAAELDQWLAEAEVPFISEEWRKLPLPERIARINEYYTLVEHTEEWERLKASALAPDLDQASPGKKIALRKIGNQILGAEFFGLFKALQFAIKRAGADEEKVSQLRQRLTDHESQTMEKLKQTVSEIAASPREGKQAGSAYGI